MSCRLLRHGDAPRTMRRASAVPRWLLLLPPSSSSSSPTRCSSSMRIFALNLAVDRPSLTSGFGSSRSSCGRFFGNRTLLTSLLPQQSNRNGSRGSRPWISVLSQRRHYVTDDRSKSPHSYEKRTNLDAGQRREDGDVTSGQPRSATPITNSLEAARQTTRAVREKVRSSLSSRSHENIYNIPNLLTVSRLIAAPVTAYLLLHDHHLWAMSLFAYAGITDLIDGWMARRFKLQTVAGSVIDPMADKALMIIVTVTLAIKGALPLYLATLILGRDASLALAAIYYRYASLPAPKTFMRYWDFSLPSAEVHPTTVSKYNTFLQLILIGSTLALPVITTSTGALSSLTLGLSESQLYQAMGYFQLLVAGTTAWSGLSYAFLPNAVTILGRDEALKAKQGARGRAIIGVSFGSVVLLAIYYALAEEQKSHIEEPPKEQTKAESREV